MAVYLGDRNPEGAVRIFFTDTFVLPLPPGHRFPMEKYTLLRRRVEAELVPPHQLEAPAAASDDELLLVHESAYLRSLLDGTLEPAAVRRIGFPWSAGMVERSRRSVGATIAASRAALDDGVAVNLAGGTHHAFPDRGEGFCVFNDVAVAARVLWRDRGPLRVAVIDTDVHQGDGTAAIFAKDPDVFTFSVHGATNFPFRKQRSDLDIALPDGAGDDAFLDAVGRGLDAAFRSGPRALVWYLAGADAHEDDRLGRLAVSREALAERDRLVLGRCVRGGSPVAVVMGGGYGRQVEDTVDVHFHSVLAAAAFADGRPVPTSR